MVRAYQKFPIKDIVCAIVHVPSRATKGDHCNVKSTVCYAGELKTSDHEAHSCGNVDGTAAGMIIQSSGPKINLV